MASKYTIEIYNDINRVLAGSPTLFSALHLYECFKNDPEENGFIDRDLKYRIYNTKTRKLIKSN